MGQEIESSHFSAEDFQAFQSRLREETQLLGEWFDENKFAASAKVGGFELETWLVDKQGRPAPVNDRFLKLTEKQSLPVVPELSLFNVEINSEPRTLHGNALKQMHQELADTWQHCNALSEKIETSLMMIGILPTVQESELVLANISQSERYRALNEQIFRLRRGRPLELDIKGRQHLQASHNDVMLESAATSFQLHLQVEPQNAARYYNAAHILSAPMVAISANSPYLFGRDLWDETRIPLFEQSVAVGGTEFGRGGQAGRVTFGAAYIESSIYECFLRNMECYPVLLPAVSESDVSDLAHLRLHNGTIWRWNRPLIGFDDKGNVHLRLEHRVVPAGPTVVDAIANAALFFGAVESLASVSTPPEKQLDFELARTNFYAAAKSGLDAKVVWLDGKIVSIVDLLQDEILPLARRGLARLDVDNDDIDLYLAGTAMIWLLWCKVIKSANSRVTLFTSGHCRR
jgi:gamma-glutamyl:cysteine ligase YbdK (ATP-grasp superfamily)